MTWLGKILTVVIFLGAVFWAYLTVQSFALRTNWKLEADKYKAAYNEAKSKREDEYNRNRAAEANFQLRLASEKNRSEGLARSVADLKGQANRAAEDTKKLQDDLAAADVKAIKLEAMVAAMTAEVAGVRKRNEFLENDRVNLVLSAENARREAVTARNSERLAQAIASDNSKKVEDLMARLSDLKAGSGSGTASGAVLRAIDKPAPPILPNLRGQVDGVSGDLMSVSIGIDAGLGVGTTLDVFRTSGDGGARYLGKAKVTSANNLFPKQAVMTFIPARNVPMGQLTPAELPRKGDLVKPLDSGN